MAQHKDLTGTDLHEPKGMSTATAGAADVGKVVASDGAGGSTVRKLKASELDTSAGSGLKQTVHVDGTATGTIVVETIDKEFFLIGPSAAATVVLELPDPSLADNLGRVVTVKRSNTSTGTLAVTTPLSGNIDGDASWVVFDKFTAYTFVSDGTNWSVAYAFAENMHGWANYGDSVQIVSAKTSLTAATRNVITNDGLSSFTDKTQLPDGITDLWDSTSNTFVHVNVGDTYMVRILIKIDGAAANDVVVLSMREKGGSLDFINETIILSKSAGAEHDIVKNYMIFADAGTVANGVELAITPDSTTNLFDIFFMITRIHRGRN